MQHAVCLDGLHGPPTAFHIDMIFTGIISNAGLRTRQLNTANARQEWPLCIAADAESPAKATILGTVSKEKFIELSLKNALRQNTQEKLRFQNLVYPNKNEIILAGQTEIYAHMRLLIL